MEFRNSINTPARRVSQGEGRERPRRSILGMQPPPRHFSAPFRQSHSMVVGQAERSQTHIVFKVKALLHQGGEASSITWRSLTGHSKADDLV
jgi:hypothetical protein